MAKSMKARRNFHLVVEDENGEREILQFEAGDTIPGDLVPLITNLSIFEGEEKFSPGNPEHEESTTGSFGSKAKGHPTGFDAMTVRELIQVANDNNIELPGNAKKAEIIMALEGNEIEVPK